MLAGKQVNGWFKADWTGQGCGERGIGAERGAPSDRGGAAFAAAPAYRGCRFAHSDGSGRARGRRASRTDPVIGPGKLRRAQPDVNVVTYDVRLGADNILD